MNLWLAITVFTFDNLASATAVFSASSNADLNPVRAGGAIGCSGGDEHLPVSRVAPVNGRDDSLRNLMALINSGAPRDSLEVHVKRQDALADSLGFLNGNVTNLRLGLNTVLFSGEKAYGSGMTRDWFTEVAHQLVDPSQHLFRFSPGKPYYLLVDPQSKNLNRRYEEFYRATGRLMALALTSQQLVGLNFPLYYYAAMLDAQIDLEGIKEDEPDLYDTFTYVLNEVETKDQYSIDIQGVEHNITTENKGNVIREKVNSLIPPESRGFFELIRSGFADVLPIRLVRDYLHPRELKDLIMGKSYINIEELVKSVDFSESRYTSDSDQIKWLWEVLRKFDQDQRRAFIHFVTGSTQIPAGGFSRMPRRINIKTLDKNNALPQASNCFNTLSLPRYETKAILKEKLLKALELSSGMEDK